MESPRFGSGEATHSSQFGKSYPQALSVPQRRTNEKKLDKNGDNKL